MRKIALMILGAASAATLLLLFASKGSNVYHQPHPYAATTWLAAMLAVGSCITMMVEFYIHRRLTHLYLGAAFLALAIIGTWDALHFPSSLPNSSTDPQYAALWKVQWLTLAMMLVVGMLSNRPSRAKNIVIRIGEAVAGSTLWASAVIFLIYAFPTISEVLGQGRVGLALDASCLVVFGLACALYSRMTFHRNNAVLAWTAYGLIFAVLAEVAGAFTIDTTFGFASTMKVFAYLSPLAGMIAEHLRMQERLHDQGSELTSLIQVQQAVTSTLSTGELYRRIVELSFTSLSASAVCLMPFDEDRGLLHCAACKGFNSEAIERQFVFRPSEGAPGTAYSSKEPVTSRDISKDALLSRKLDGVSGLGSAVFSPLVIADKCMGVLAVFFGKSVGSRAQKEHLRLLDALATQAAIAVDASKVQGRIVDSDKTSEDYAREMDIVWEIGQAVASKLEQQDLVDTLSEKLRTAVGAKGCSVLVFDPDESGMKIWGHKILARHHSIAEHIDQCDLASAEVARRGETLLMSNLPNSCHCKYPDMVLEDGGTHHLLSVPMALRGFMGAITVFRQNLEPFGDKEKRLLGRLAPLVAAGIRNAELYEREKRVVESLRKSYAPDLAAAPSGYEFDVRYRSSFDESRVGGDFYDVIDLEDGKYGIIIGDVSGKGLDAAVYTTMTRYMIRAYASDSLDPVQVVERLNAALYRHTPDHKFVTLVYAVLDTKTNILTYVNAGHEYPLLYKSADGRTHALPTTGAAAGAVTDVKFESEKVTLGPGDVLVLYTDGASEARNDGGFLGTDGLRSLIDERMKAGGGDLADTLVTEIESFAEGHLTDDLVLFILRARVPGSLF